jgi:hypothetical protein
MSASPAAPEEGRPVAARTPTTSQLTEPRGRFDLLRWTLLLLAPLVLVPVLGPFALPFWLPWLGYSLSSLSSLSSLYSLYSRYPAAFDEHSCVVGTVLAAHAAIAMSAAREHERADRWRARCGRAGRSGWRSGC